MKKVLVVEDTAAVREEILDLLRFEGFDVIGAEDGLFGVQRAREFLPDLIICDILMPGLDGYGVLEALRKEPVTAMIPFLFLTAKAAKEDIRQGMELGADDYLTKPFYTEELLAAISARLARQATVNTQHEQKLEDLRGNITHALPHELLTPLNGILGHAEIIADDYETMKRHEIGEIAENICLSAKRLHRLIQNFLVYVQIEVTAVDPEKVCVLQNTCTVNPGEIIADVAMRKAQQVQRAADLTLELVGAPIQIAEENLRKIVEELTDNAFKFSQCDTPVHITTAVTQEDFCLEIHDAGRGITPAHIAHIGAYMQFERKFYEQQGSGLGLSIAKRLVELHGGHLTITSVPETQTTVRVTLKLQCL